jgi:hypothetical protein
VAATSRSCLERCITSAIAVMRRLVSLGFQATRVLTLTGALQQDRMYLPHVPLRYEYDAAVTDKKKKSLWANAWLFISVAAPIAGAAASAQLFSLARDAETPAPPADAPDPQFWQTEQFWLGTGGVVCLVVALGVGITAKFLDSRKKGKLEQTIDEQAEKLAGGARATSAAVAAANLAQLVKVHDELIPVASSIADMARYPLADREPYLKAVAQATASALEQLVSEHVHRPRAVIYSLDADAEPVSMKPIGFKGRGKRPRPFKAGTPRGDAAIEFAFESQPGRIWPDLTTGGPEGFVGSASDYKTFVSIPIWTETGAYGMVSLDAPKPNSLADGDQALTELIAEVMSIAFEVGQDQNTQGPDDGDETNPELSLNSNN